MSWKEIFFLVALYKKKVKYARYLTLIMYANMHTEIQKMQKRTKVDAIEAIEERQKCHKVQTLVYF